MRPLITTLALAATLAAVSLTTTSITHLGSAGACAGLIGSNGAVNLGRTTTLAAYHHGVEHYITAFEFQGGGGEFGTLIPLPGVPSNVERGGDWTLQRLRLETDPPVFEAAAGDEAFARSAEVLQEVRIDALDITVLKGGGSDVATWASEHGFRLSPDAPEVLDFYASRSPIFLAAVFDGEAAAARGQAIGDGTPVHITIPTTNPWVPLRILGLGKQPADRVDADVYLLTDDEPALLPVPGENMALTHSQPATTTLLDDLRSDAGMGWVAQSAWLTKLQIDSSAAALGFDLAVDTTGAASPSRVAAGLEYVPDALPVGLSEAATTSEDFPEAIAWAVTAAAVLALLVLVVARTRPSWLPRR